MTLTGNPPLYRYVLRPASNLVGIDQQTRSLRSHPGNYQEAEAPYTISS